MEGLIGVIGPYVWTLVVTGLVVGAIGLVRRSWLLCLLAALLLFIATLPFLPSGWLALLTLALAGGFLYAAAILGREGRSD